MAALSLESGCWTRFQATGGGNVSTIGAIGLDGIRTGLSLPGAIDGETMVFFVQEWLAPTLKRGELVFFDHCPIHHLEEVEEAIEARGAWAIFLPRYSPDLNPIENCWSKVRHPRQRRWLDEWDDLKGDRGW
jgi:transposase